MSLSIEPAAPEPFRTNREVSAWETVSTKDGNDIIVRTHFELAPQQIDVINAMGFVPITVEAQCNHSHAVWHNCRLVECGPYFVRFKQEWKL
jgi:hypothetical protein